MLSFNYKKNLKQIGVVLFILINKYCFFGFETKLKWVSIIGLNHKDEREHNNNILIFIRNSLHQNYTNKNSEIITEKEGGFRYS